MDYKRTLINAMRRASSIRAYRDLGAALTRTDSERLIRFTDTTAMYAIQNRGEFAPFLELVRAKQPHDLVEIGTARGGTFFMLCQVAAPDACLATVDLTLPPTPVATLGHGRQHVIGIEGSSRDAGVEARIRALFSGGLDVLFIDGDHSYDGVKADFERYRDLVRSGGIIAFHDIVEARSGDAYVGGVPQFWQEVKDMGWESREFVESWDQNGKGIGIVVSP